MAKPQRKTRKGSTSRKRSTASRSAPTRGKPARKRKPKVSRGRRVAARIGKTVATAMALCLVVGVATLVIGYRTIDTPDANADFQTNTSFVYYGNGKAKLGSLSVQNRQSVPLAEMPDSIKDAVVAAENRTFWTDPGFSVSGMARAALRIAQGEDLQGGSTITQQYIKIMYLSQDQTVTRKFKELMIAAKIGRTVPKEKILEDYLNTIYFGRGAYGVQAASKSFFDVDAKDLSVPQAAVLASVLNNPGIFDPSVDEDNTERLLDRYRYVITSMADMGQITQAEAAEYRKKLPKLPEIDVNERYGGSKGFLLKMVEDELSAAGFEEAEINGGGLKIITTFDKQAQKAAQKSAKSRTKEAANAADEKASDLHAAVASVEVGTGEVLALYGGPNYLKNSRNWATTPRPAASTFKTFALAAGLKDGKSLYSTFNGDTFTPQGDPVPVRNEFSYQYGPVNLIKATADSVNTAFVDLTMSMENGPQKITKMAEAAGAQKPKGGPGWDENSRIALGAAEVSPLDQATAYATFANEGRYVPTHVVREVQDAQGRVIYTPDVTEKKVVSKKIAHDVTFALSSVVEEGTGSSVQTIQRPVAGKTGTNGVDDDITSAWFVAYTKQISTAVMFVAGDSGNEDLDDYARPGDSTFFGGTYPALTWADYMVKASEGMPVKEFEGPDYVNSGQPQLPQQQNQGTQYQPRNTDRNDDSGDESNDSNQQPEKKSDRDPGDEATKESENTSEKKSDEKSDEESSKESTDRSEKSEKSEDRQRKKSTEDSDDTKKSDRKKSDTKKSDNDETQGSGDAGADGKGGGD